MAEKKKSPASWRAVVIAIASYMTISISIVILNKKLLSGGVPYPVAMTWAQMVIAVPCFVLVRVVSQSTGVLPDWPSPRISLPIAAKVLPVTATFVAMVVLNNACLLNVEASFYMVARSSHIFFSIVLSWVILSTRASVPTMASCAVVTAGLVAGSLGEGARFSPLGTGLGVASTAFVALYAVLVRRGSDAVGGNKWELAWYNTVLSCALLPIAMFASGEVRNAAEAAGSSEALAVLAELTGRGRDTLPALVASGLLGFLLNLAAYAQITLTDPLTHMVSGTVKGILQTFIGAWVFGTPLTPLNLAGSALVVAGSTWYSLIRMGQGRDTTDNANKKTK